MCVIDVRAHTAPPLPEWKVGQVLIEAKTVEKTLHINNCTTSPVAGLQVCPALVALGSLGSLNRGEEAVRDEGVNEDRLFVVSLDSMHESLDLSSACLSFKSFFFY